MDDRRLFSGRLIVAGETRTMTGERGGYVVTAEAIREAIADGLFNGLACFADHAADGPSVRRLVGVWQGVTWDEATGAAVGRLLAYETAGTRPVLDLLDQWLADRAAAPETAGGDIGVSLVFYPRLAADGRTVRSMIMVESADLVMFPASEGSRILGRVALDAGRPPAATSPRAPIVALSRGGMKRDRPGDAAAGSGVTPVGPDDAPAGNRYSQDRQCSREKQQMNQTTTDNDRPRVALVRGDGPEFDERPPATAAATAAVPATATAAPPVPMPAALPAGSPAAPDAAAGWLEALRTSAATAVIRSSGLPAAVQERLGEGRYESADEVYAAVERARGELAALNEAGVVRLGAAPLRLRDPLDEARGLMGFFFGAAEATTPPINLRSFSDLYVALTGDVYFRGVFDGERVLFGGASSATLPNLVVDAMNRVVVEQFQALTGYRWYEFIVAVTANDGRLHDMKWITLGGVGDLPTVAEGASYTEMSLSDARESAAFVKRGGYVGITRETIRNSDVMQLQAIPRALATAAVRSRSAAVSALFTANGGAGPTLAQDNKPLFHTADHANLLTTALGTDNTAWRAARTECFKHTEIGSGKYLGVFPKYLLVPADLYDQALVNLGYGDGSPASYTPEAQGRGRFDPRPVPLLVPDWTDATDWAYIVDPAVYPVIQMSYSQAPGGREHPAPELFAVTGETNGLLFTNDTLPIKVRDEFAVGVNGPRGIGKRNV